MLWIVVPSMQLAMFLVHCNTDFVCIIILVVYLNMPYIIVGYIYYLGQNVLLEYLDVILGYLRVLRFCIANVVCVIDNIH